MKEKDIFIKFLRAKGLKDTRQREKVAEAFLRSEKHLCADDLFALVKKSDPALGYATVYRTLKLMREAGLAREVNLGDGKKRFEHLLGHKHHDHLICVHCGKCIEVLDPKIEHLQTNLAGRHGFKIEGHRLEIFGLCRDCK